MSLYKTILRPIYIIYICTRINIDNKEELIINTLEKCLKEKIPSLS